MANIFNLLRENNVPVSSYVKPKIIALSSSQGSGGTISNPGLFDGITIDEWNTSKIHYWNEADNNITLELKTKCDIYRSGTTSWKATIGNLIIEKLINGTWVDVTNDYTQTISAITDNQLEKNISNIGPGTFKFKKGISGRIDSEWAVINKEYVDFPISIIEEIDIPEYSATLINGEEQLLITPSGKFYLTKGDGTFVPAQKTDLSNYYNKTEVDQLIANSGGGQGSSHTHTNKSVLDNLNIVSDYLCYNGNKIVSTIKSIGYINITCSQTNKQYTSLGGFRMLNSSDQVIVTGNTSVDTLDKYYTNLFEIETGFAVFSTDYKISNCFNSANPVTGHPYYCLSTSKTVLFTIKPKQIFQTVSSFSFVPKQYDSSRGSDVVKIEILYTNGEVISTIIDCSSKAINEIVKVKLSDFTTATSLMDVYIDQENRYSILEQRVAVLENLVQ